MSEIIIINDKRFILNIKEWKKLISFQKRKEYESLKSLINNIYKK